MTEEIGKNSIIRQGTSLNALHHATVIYVLTFQNKALHGKWSKK